MAQLPTPNNRHQTIKSQDFKQKFLEVKKRKKTAKLAILNQSNQNKKDALDLITQFRLSKKQNIQNEGLAEKINNQEQSDSQMHKDDNPYLLCLRYGIQKAIFFKRHLAEQELQCQKTQNIVFQQFGEVPSLLPRDDGKKGKLKQSNVADAFISFQIKICGNQMADTLSVSKRDIEKLQPGGDLNDSIIECYIKLLKNSLLPPKIIQSTMIFSSYLIQQLVGRLLKTEQIYQWEPEMLNSQFQKEVVNNYSKVQRWTKKNKIFTKKYLVIPINAFNHWFCIIVTNPQGLMELNGKSQMIYCDSLYQGREFLANIVRKYLQLEIADKNSKTVSVNSTNLPLRQLLLPRQTNKHDCGLYMLLFIQELLTNEKNHLANLQYPLNRIKLNLFGQKQIFSMRNRIANFLIKLIDGQDYNTLVQEFKRKNSQLKKYQDFDKIQDQQLKKYTLLTSQRKIIDISPQGQFYYRLRFYLDQQINYFQPQ